MEAGTASAPVPAESPAEYTRLHVSPFNPDLLRTIVPPSILPNARNISYHSLQTFPESPYGFIDLPIMDAAKVRKKLNGSILKGKKIRIEEARPATKSVASPEVDTEEPARPHKERKDASKKRKLGEETLTGAEIGDRSVKRGWTTPSATLSKLDKHSKDKRKAAVKSKYTTGPECLFKTVLPPNVAVNTKATSSDAKPRRRTKAKAGKDAVVHEFAKSTKYATFLRGSIGSSGKKVVAEFITGKGWVDKDGNVVEEMVSRTRTPAQTLEKKSHKEPLDNATPSFEEEHASEDGSSSDDSGDADGDQVLRIATPTTKGNSPTSSSSSSSNDKDSDSGGSSASSRDHSHADSSSESSEEELDTAEGSEFSRPDSLSGPATGLSIKIPKPAMVSKRVAPEDVHPLEALYKKPVADAGGTAKATPALFSFFDPDGDVDESLDAEPYDRVPFTPFTQKEFEYRGMRSAAPTPDTIHANRRFMWPTNNIEENDDQLQEDSSPNLRKKSGIKTDDAPSTEVAESEFQKWFYEHRGETSRAWKKRRKLASKEKRQRENRKNQGRAI